MFQKTIAGVVLILALMLTSSAYAGKVELTTYYPAPFGEYQELKAQKSTVTGTGTTNDTIAFQAGGLNTVSPGTVPPGLVVTNANNVGIGTDDPQGILDVQSKTSAFYPPRVARNDDIVNPGEGAIIYNIDAKRVEVYDGTDWVNAGGGKPVWHTISAQSHHHDLLVMSQADFIANQPNGICTCNDSLTDPYAITAHSFAGNISRNEHQIGYSCAGCGTAQASGENHMHYQAAN